ncbi:hypothetical protein Pla123a_04010 [Posidoniimonas polymericola]|uniref:CobQ/CobB/MinD/ParA nucleotide binding domain protein n=1 Tax=Posidoniimonas polymericola TaxID=2528002 RepID=A0A5C5ZE22_9BACT|nr:CpsD/CapB family tyrosine-protein kinase [Posidoniimonas polymericola]TWT85594.1 hypothetical protein Pla123a_04010 [Posidoniimonas polymericola]
MSFTDQAFIKAYRTDTQTEPTPVPRPVSHSHETHRHGPHANFAKSPERRPLSEAIAEERAAQAAHAAQQQPAGVQASIAGVTLATFAVPEVASRLALECGEEYRRMMAYASRSGGVIGLLGAGHGVGCSTTTLAAGLAIAADGRAPAAVIDAAPGEPGLARSLGVCDCRSLSRTLENGGAAADALIYGAAQNISLGFAFDEHTVDERRVSGALRGLIADHSAVLVDLGCDIESIATQPARGADSLRLDAVVLVRRANANEADLMFARRVLTAAGQNVIGVVESFA